MTRWFGSRGVAARPAFGALLQEPRVEPVRRDHGARVRSVELVNPVPVGLTRAVHDEEADAGALSLGEEGSRAVRDAGVLRRRSGRREAQAPTPVGGG